MLAELAGERERLLDLSRREAAHAAVMSSGASQQSRGMESNLLAAEQKLLTSESRVMSLQQELGTVRTKLEADLARAQTRSEQAEAEAGRERNAGSQHAKRVLELEKRVSALGADLENEKTRAKDLLQKTNR